MIRRLLLSALLAATAAVPAIAQDYRARLPEDEVIYFVLPDRFENGDPANDRGGLSGDRLKTGFDPAAKGFYHGGDLKGLIKRLDYIQNLGATAIWVAPIFKNKPVQGPPGQESSGYHGYWITDFTQVDPHFGTNADFKALVDAAHARGVKVYMDIVVNHTADVIQYRDCPGDCAYRSKADYPFSRRGAAGGAPINPGFLGDAVQTPENFARLTDMNFAYQPFVPKGEEHAKVPDWLNDIRYYHNRGNSYWKGESVVYGDFVGLDDVATENPRVAQGFIDIFGQWVDDFGIDGFRIDTSKHVNSEFWQAFVPAMKARAKARGIANFHIFAEVMVDGTDSATLARYNRTDRYDSLDFAFTWAVVESLGTNRGSEALERLFANDILFEGGPDAARHMPTFLSNHDIARLGTHLRKARPGISDDELFARVKLAHAMLLTLRGVPTIYSGDEQGFVGDGGDQDAREDMFASKVAVYNDNVLLGTKSTTAQANFDEAHPLYRLIADLAKLRVAHPALTRGRTVVRAVGKEAGVFAVSRIDAASGQEVLLVFNTTTKPISANVAIDPATTRFSALRGTCPAAPIAPGSVAITLAPLDFMICKAERP
ncbi:MAG: alpha-amylase [Sphingomonas sp.]|uniref:alpha-amylase family glycosyl hydrolase n=1 Tax=Sphingomonas sp. TaxID=28214 RepID=UPI0025CF0806|nr:alpha-amylase family glycosyl hydrolase [Sphingomonas sp.]MBY0283091.1 alpha-amylase [Sphingomonas sp.]